MTVEDQTLSRLSSILDRPILSALLTRHSHLSRQDGNAVIYDPEVSPFGSTGHPGNEDLDGFARLVAQCPNEVALMQAHGLKMPASLQCTLHAAGFQMVLDAPLSAETRSDLVELSADDIPELLALVALTEPGPFQPRTIEMGGYWGLRINGALVAMAGERLKPEGFTEISAVCVHPAFRKQGIARTLVVHVANQIQARGEQPFLHLYADNTPALRLYESLGFRVRKEIHIIKVKTAE